MNLNKTKVIPFSCNATGLKYLQQINFDINGEIYSIKAETVIKYLGIYLYCHFRWDHVYYVVKKLQKTISRFTHLKAFLPTKILGYSRTYLYKFLRDSSEENNKNSHI